MASGYSYTQLISPVQDRLHFMKKNQENFNVITNSSNTYGPRARFEFSYQLIMHPQPDSTPCCQDESQVLS